jgi:hypothetical protein
VISAYEEDDKAGYTLKARIQDGRQVEFNRKD